MSDTFDDEPDHELSERIRDWIEKKTAAYHPRKPSSKTPSEYRAGLMYTAAERLATLYEESPAITSDHAEYIVYKCLGKSAAQFNGMLLEEVRRAKDAATHLAVNRATAAETKVEVLEPMLEKVDRMMAANATMVAGMQSFMERMMERMENLTIASSEIQKRIDKPGLEPEA